MFARVFALLPLALLASATHLNARDTTVNQCNTGNQFCCNSKQAFQGQSEVVPGFGLINAVVAAVVGVDSTCGLLAVGGGCNQQATCCDHNESNGLVVVSCSPINL